MIICHNSKCVYKYQLYQCPMTNISGKTIGIQNTVPSLPQIIITNYVRYHMKIPQLQVKLINQCS